MKPLSLPIAGLMLCICTSATAQMKSYNQNSARSNHTRSLSVTLGSGYVNPLQNGTDSSLFNKSGLDMHVAVEYLVGKFGLGFSSGFLKTTFDQGKLNDYLTNNGLSPDKFVINTNGSQAPYLFVGPTMRLGSKFMIDAFARGGVVFSSPSSYTVQQQGAIRQAIRIEPLSKGSFGWNAGTSFHYALGNGISMGLFADLLQFKSEVNRYDARIREGLTPTLISNTISNLNSGISVRYSIDTKKQKQWSPANFRSSGTPLTQRVLKSKTKSNQNNDRNANSGDVSVIDTEQPAVIKTKTKSNQSNDRMNQSCGAVTTTTTYPDGRVEQQTFACPDDAAQYKAKLDGSMPNRISTNVTVPKQTQGATFGEKVNQGLHAAGSALSQGVSRYLISGKIVHSTSASGSNGIVSNAAVSSVSSLSGGSGSGAAAASYARSAGDNTPVVKGASVVLYAREAGSGMATGKRQYQPIYADGIDQSAVCNPCLATVKNPLYDKKGGEGTNPLYNGRNMATGDNDCDGTAEGFAVQLVDKNSGAVVARTVTNRCGEYWFANVPEGNYVAVVLARFLSKKGYDYYQAQSNLSVAGMVAVPEEQWQHIITTGNERGGGKASMQDLSIVIADVDGDGLEDRLIATGTFSDGTSQDLSETALRSGGTGKVSMQDFHFSVATAKSGGGTGKVNVQDLSITAAKSGGGTGKVNLQDLHFTAAKGMPLRATGTFSDGSTQDVTSCFAIQQQSGVIQLSAAVADLDGDGDVDLIWSPRSNLGVTAKQTNVNVSELSAAVINTSRSNIKNMAMHIGDVDGDGAPELIVGNKISDLGMSRKSGGFQNGDVPDQDDITEAIPGNPIGGISIKGGKNPGGGSSIMRTNSFGEFEFPDLTAGSYTFTVETPYVISDITEVDLTPDAAVATKGGIVKITASQNSQSLKTGKPPVRWSAPEVLQSSMDDLEATLNDLDLQLGSDANSTRAGVSTSRSNIRNARKSLSDIDAAVQTDDVAGAQSKLVLLNTQLQALQQSLQSLGTPYQSISNVLKTKHDTVKNSINNVR